MVPVAHQPDVRPTSRPAQPLTHRKRRELLAVGIHPPNGPLRLFPGRRRTDARVEYLYGPGAEPDNEVAWADAAREGDEQGGASPRQASASHVMPSLNIFSWSQGSDWGGRLQPFVGATT